MNSFKSSFVILLVIFFTSVSITYADITTGLVGHYTFDTADLTSNVHDSSGLNNHAFLNDDGAQTTSTSTVTGQIGQAIRLGQSYYYIEAGADTIDDFDFDLDESFTFALWLRVNSSSPSSYSIFGTMDPLSPYFEGYLYSMGNQLAFCDSELLNLSLNSTTGYFESFCGEGLSPILGRWQHIIIAYSGTTKITKTYVNGVLINTISFGEGEPSGSIKAIAPLRLGWQMSGYISSLIGDIDDFRIYNRELTLNDASQLYRLTYDASVTTSAASLVSTSTVVLNGSITDQSDIASSTSRGFIYGTSSGIYSATSSDTGTYGTGAFSKNLTGLTPQTTYYFKAFALNATSTNYGSELSFTTSSDVDAPTVSQLFASVVSYTSATLNSQITATGGSDATQYGFAYGTSADLSSVIATSTLGSYSGTGFLEEAISGLSIGTTYYFRSYATNSGGTSYSTIESFITRSYVAPTTIPQDASLVAITTATLNGQIQDTNGSSATERGFVYGTTQSFGATTTESGTFGTGSYNSAVTGLSANTTYYYKAYATNGSGTAYSTDVETFTTLASTATSVVETDGLASLGTTTVTIYGNIVSTGGSDTITHGITYGTSPTLGTVIATTSLGTYSGTGTFSSGITGLTANTTYYYRAYVTNAIGTSFGEIKSFVTVDNNGATVAFDLPSGGMQNYTLQLDVTVDSVDPSITIEWPLESGVTSYTIYRKATTDTNWGTSIASVLYGARRFVDMNVDLGAKYEYKVVKNITGGTYAYGYIYSGVEVPLVDDRGKVILVIDDATVTAMPDEVDQLVLDLSGDGWTVIYEEVDDSTATVSSVKTIIEGHYDEDPTNVKAVFLVGAIPVPYSGDIYPDGHPDHQGAWPADMYYGEFDGTWTDTTVNHNNNTPGDGKFDQDFSTSRIDIAVGRVDLRNMGSFGAANALHQRYLNKNHNFRNKVIDVPNQGVIADGFGTLYGEAFAASAWRAFSVMLGGDRISTSTTLYTDFLFAIRNSSYKWSYANGGGGYAGIHGGTTLNYGHYAAQPTYAVFTQLFGSYFGDWNNSDGFLRSPLAGEGYGLTSVWGGRPHWLFHSTAMGDPMTTSILMTMNNNLAGHDLYSGTNVYQPESVHITFLGDPTLRTDIVAPATNLSVATTSATVVTLDWDASADTVLGYNIYSAHTVYGPYTKLNSSLITDTTATTTFNAYNAQYQVRAVLLQTTPSGSYYNSSQGDHQALTVYATPVLGVISDTSGAINTDSDPIALTVSDNTTALADLDFTVTSSDQSLVDDANISLGIVDDIQYITLTPETDATGSTTITVSVSDGSNSTQRSFIYTVDDIADTTAPSIPGSVSASALSTSEIRLTWSASTDTGTDGGTASGLAGYTVYKNGTFFATTTSTTYDFTGLASGTTYTFYVKSFDENVNISGQSSTVSRATNQASSGGGGGGGGGGSRKSTPSPTPKASVTPSASQNGTASVKIVSNNKIGDSGSTVLSLQKFLIDKGFLSPQYATAYFGPITQSALNAYNSSNTYTPAPQVNTVVNQNLGGGIKSGLSLGSNDSSVRDLQKFLNSNGFAIVSSGPGSLGNETMYFGPATRAALVKFQEKYANDILVPNGLKSGTGMVGPSTLLKINKIESCKKNLASC